MDELHNIHASKIYTVLEQLYSNKDVKYIYTYIHCMIQFYIKNKQN